MLTVWEGLQPREVAEVMAGERGRRAYPAVAGAGEVAGVGR